ncbi:MAG: Flp pilus assembly protein CpaB [Streptosporangiales bacterium]|nr:Flp pilus assembly protein CpaB [Streptosporangiales bacterium]
MNPRQRRGALMMILAGVLAVGVLVILMGYVSSVRAEVGSRSPVLTLRQDVPANTPLTADMVDQSEIPDRWAPDRVLHDVSQLQNKVATADLRAGTFLQEGMVADPPRLQPGQREIAIMINAETGVAGKVEPNDQVDIYATFPGDTQDTQSCAVRVISRARVIDVGKLQAERENDAGAVAETRVVPITFALTPDDSLALTYAESFASKVRLALIGDGEIEVPANDSICQVPSG